MTTLSATIVYKNSVKGEGLRYIMAEVESATANDTWTVSEFTAVKDTVALRLDTGAEVDCTEATNIVTIGAGPSSTPLTILVSGW